MGGVIIIVFSLRVFQLLHSRFCGGLRPVLDNIVDLGRFRVTRYACNGLRCVAVLSGCESSLHQYLLLFGRPSLTKKMWKRHSRSELGSAAMKKGSAAKILNKALGVRRSMLGPSTPIATERSREVPPKDKTPTLKTRRQARWQGPMLGLRARATM